MENLALPPPSVRSGFDADTVSHILVQAFMSQMTVNAWIKDPEGRYLVVNRTVEKTIQSHDRPVIGSTDAELNPGAVANKLREHDLQVLRTGRPMEVVEEYPGPVEDGGRAWFSLKFPVTVGQQRCVGGVAVDITAYATGERERRQAQEKLHQILDAITDMVLVKGPGSRLEWANKAFRDAYGMTNEQLQGLIDAPFSPPDNTLKYVQDDLQVWNSGRSLDIPEEPMNVHDGKSRLVHTVKSPIFGREGKVINTVGVSRDITERRALELELRQAQKLESVGRLAAGIAHEINTPIQFVGDHNCFVRESFSGLLGLLATYKKALAVAGERPLKAEEVAQLRVAEETADLAYLEESLPKAFDAIADGVSRVARLVAAMKEFGHPDRGEMSEADINRAITNTLTIAANELKLVTDVVTDLGPLPPVRCLISEVNQVFLNLLTNAAHAIADAHPGERGTITITSRVVGEMVRISFADNGTGIRPEHAHKLFEPFFTTKQVGRGTGQGLPIARAAVEKQGGSLTFDTELGRGTTFHVQLPIRQAPPSPDR